MHFQNVCFNSRNFSHVYTVRKSFDPTKTLLLSYSRSPWCQCMKHKTKNTSQTIHHYYKDFWRESKQNKRFTTKETYLAFSLSVSGKIFVSFLPSSRSFMIVDTQIFNYACHLQRIVTRLHLFQNTMNLDNCHSHNHTLQKELPHSK